MPRASELKKGQVVDINGQPCQAKQIDVKSPSSRGAQTLYKVRFSNVRNGQKVEGSYSGDIMLKEVDLLRRRASFLYREGDMFTFMDSEDYSQHTLSADQLDEQKDYLVDGLEEIMLLIIEGQLVAIELPPTVTMEVVDTAPAIKGATAAGRTKTATLTSGLEIQVPEYLTTGEKVKVNTVTGKFMSRA
ncbi:elongation factor P-like protein EfpL [Aestuariirhabdus litorea]|uniref:Elongation factor P-like protein n=1 Tax=Aestuariirhabdus litorea TaxID=2528527 RepID=A0A3P3VPL4_9GAMM|nr:elongation factor P-like protein YeiP [Aestuariirhabdus litorea]RRJ83858.1 elongation factor P-like protein YeiP [Aestuariirhabdus litorea]RWW97081.1 elongation factor P-like protein YeiP [Endozoicomonadaceae bacterium GTF-13]